MELGVSDEEGNRVLVTNQNHRFQEQLIVYRNHFENGFLEATKNYYIKESSEFVQSNSITEYLKKVYFLLVLYLTTSHKATFRLFYF